MGRKSKGRIGKHATYTPEFADWVGSQIQGDEGFGGVVERLFAENTAKILELQSQLAEYQRHAMQRDAVNQGSQATDDAVRQVSLALQAWMMNAADLDARQAFEVALKRCIEKG